MAYLENYNTRQLRNVLGTFTTGVTVVTTRDKQGKLHGVTANSFSSVSLEPPLVLWSQALTSKSLTAFGEAEHFAINVLADDQVAISNHFAKSAEDKFASVPYTEGLEGVPVLAGTVAHFECLRVASYPAGDHVIYIGEVKRVAHSGRRPLAFAHGRYMVPYAHELGPLALQVGSAPVATAEAVRIAGDALTSVQKSTGPFTLALAAWGNHGPTIIRWLPGSDAVSAPLSAGLVMSITRTATGRAFAAFLPPDITRPFIDEDLRVWRVADEDEKEQRGRFEDETVLARTLGVATASVPGPTAINHVPLNAYSAPIFNNDGEMILALSLAAPAKENPGAALLQLMLAAARDITTQISTT